jgi:drug/metabolite transporter (DMT)-like permease
LAFGDTGQAAHRARGIALALMAGVLWSLGGLLIKWVEWNAFAIAGARSFIAALVIWAYLRKPRFTWSPVQLTAAVTYAAVVTLFVAANKLTTAANAIVLQYTAPVFAAFFGWWLLGERARRRDWVTLAVVMAAMTLFFMGKLSPGGMLGNLLALTSGVCFALLVTLLRKQRSGSNIESVLLGNVLTFLIGLPFMFQGSPGGHTWVGLIILGVFQLGISYVLFAEAVKHISAVESVLVPIVEPLLNPLWVLIVLHEAPGPWSLVGGAIVLTAVTVRCLMAPPKPS